LSTNLRASHTEVDEAKPILWVQELTKQRKKEELHENLLVINSEVTYQSYSEYTCPRRNLREAVCGGQTVLRSLSIDRCTGTTERIFIGCEHYRGREKGHMYFSLSKHQLHFPTLLQLFGKARCYIHQDILDAIEFAWENIIEGIISISILAFKRFQN
jgi:hypothetical protein